MQLRERKRAERREKQNSQEVEESDSSLSQRRRKPCLEVSLPSSLKAIIKQIKNPQNKPGLPLIKSCGNLLLSNMNPPSLYSYNVVEVSQVHQNISTTQSELAVFTATSLSLLFSKMNDEDNYMDQQLQIKFNLQDNETQGQDIEASEQLFLECINERRMTLRRLDLAFMGFAPFVVGLSSMIQRLQNLQYMSLLLPDVPLTEDFATQLKKVVILEQLREFNLKVSSVVINKKQVSEFSSAFKATKLRKIYLSLPFLVFEDFQFRDYVHLIRNFSPDGILSLKVHLFYSQKLKFKQLQALMDAVLLNNTSIKYIKCLEILIPTLDYLQEQIENSQNIAEFMPINNNNNNHNPIQIIQNNNINNLNNLNNYFNINQPNNNNNINNANLKNCEKNDFLEKQQIIKSQIVRYQLNFLTSYQFSNYTHDYKDSVKEFNLKRLTNFLQGVEQFNQEKCNFRKEILYEIEEFIEFFNF